MKKSLVALAVLAASGAASAQSSVTLFGVVDAGISYYEVKSQFYTNTPLTLAPFVVPAGVKRSAWQMSNSGYNSSRLGFRGTEDLGGGLAASFWLEAGLANDTGLGGGLGVTGAFVFNRRSTVSLSGPFGEVRLGRDYVPTFWNDTVFDPFGTNGVGSNIIGRISLNLATARGPGSLLSTNDNYVRTGNSVGYFLPSNLGGFYGQAMYSLHENPKFDNVANSPTTRGRYVGGRFGYANGPLDVAIAYGESTAADALVGGTSIDNKINTLNLGASWDFGVVKLFGELSQVEDKLKTSNPTTFVFGTETNLKDKYQGGLIGVTVPVGAGLIRASYGMVKYKNGSAVITPFLFGTTNLDARTEQFALGYVHNLSKRTALYATAAFIKVKDGQNNPAIMGGLVGGSGLSYLSTGAGVQGYAPHKAMGYDFGIRHSF